ncbi:MAG: hypothetical protein ACLPXT_13395 [Terracidiphilus sp.]
MDNDSDVRRQKMATALKWGAGLVGAIVVAPFIFLAVKGIVGLAIAAAIGLVITQLAPVFAQKLANWRMKLVVDEVEKNPIETMQNLFIDKTRELERADNNIADFETEIRNFDDQVEGFKQQYPAEADSYETLSQRMHEALAGMKTEQSAARAQLSDFEKKIAKAKAIYKMSVAAQNVVKLSRSAEAEVFAKIKEQVAFDAVRSQLNRSFANLNLALERRTDAQSMGALSAGSPHTINMPALPDRVPVSRKANK